MQIINKINLSLASLFCIALIILMLPGQNKIQTISIQPNFKKVLGTQNIEVSKNDLPKLVSNHQTISLNARSVIAVDVDSAVILYEKNSDAKVPPASTTKIMTALVALDEYELDEIITIENENFSIGNKSHIKSGEKLSVESLLFALLVSSGNDAALALAQNHPKGYAHFINLMNLKAKDLHLTNSNFSNVSGVEQPSHYSTARDLGILTREAIKNPIFSKIVEKKEYTIQSIDGIISHKLINTNELLGEVDGVVGVKTGWTKLAGECLVTYVKRGDRKIVTVILGSDDRFGESKKLIEWIFNNYQWNPFPL